MKKKMRPETLIITQAFLGKLIDFMIYKKLINEKEFHSYSGKLLKKYKK